MIREMSYSVTVPDEATARAVADELVQRGHLLVAVRPVPDSPLEGRFVGWWCTHSLVVDPPYDGPLEEPRAEDAAVAVVARRHGGKAGGRYGQFPDQAIRRFWRVGLVHELDRAEADEIRERIVAAQVRAVPSLPAAVGLRCGSFKKPAAELRAAAEVVRRTAGDSGLGSWSDTGGFEGVSDLVAGIADEVFHQGSIDMRTAGAVPVLAGIAAAGQVSDFYRAMTLMVLFQMGTSGRRRLGYEATEAGSAAGAEFADEAATRAAVAAALPELVDRASGACELTDFLLGGLCASARRDLPAAVDRIAKKSAGTARMPVVTLLRAVAAGDEEATRSALAEVAAASPDLIDLWQNPNAAVEYQALDTLDTLLQAELDNARLSRLGMLLRPGPT